MGDGFVPRLKPARRAWLNNFVEKLAAPGNGYVTKYNVPAETVATLVHGRAWLNWTFENIAALRTRSQSLTQFQDQVISGLEGGGELSVPAAPAYTELPSEGSPTVTIPPVANVIGFATAVGKMIKASPNYSVADGEDLGLQGPGRAPLPPAATTAPDLSKSRLTTGGHVEIVWKKGPFQGLRIEVIRDITGVGGGSGGDAWTFLAIDTEPNYTDRVAPPSGTVQIHRYRGIYIYNDEPYGQWSQPVEMTVRG